MNPSPTDLGPITDLRLPPAATHAVLFGGTFDPPHLAHAKIPAAARDRRFGAGAWLVYTPAARSPHKDTGPIAPDADRLAMVRLATRAVDRSLVWSDEIDRAPRAPGPSYTIDTLTRARAALPAGTILALLLGSDQCATFHTWRQPREILALAQPVVMLRPPHQHPKDAMDALRAASFWTDAELKHWEQAIDAQAVIDASSTILREQLAAGDAAATLNLDPRVLQYIQSKGLYTTPRNA